MPHLSSSMLGGELLFLSGQIAFDASGQVTGDITEQTQRCLERLENELKKHGLDRQTVVKTSVWLTRRSDFATFDATYAAFFGDHKPTRSTVISALAFEGALVEIEVVASGSRPKTVR